MCLQQYVLFSCCMSVVYTVCDIFMLFYIVFTVCFFSCCVYRLKFYLVTWGHSLAVATNMVSWQLMSYVTIHPFLWTCHMTVIWTLDLVQAKQWWMSMLKILTAQWVSFCRTFLRCATKFVFDLLKDNTKATFFLHDRVTFIFKNNSHNVSI